MKNKLTFFSLYSCSHQNLLQTTLHFYITDAKVSGTLQLKSVRHLILRSSRGLIPADIGPTQRQTTIHSLNHREFNLIIKCIVGGGFSTRWDPTQASGEHVNSTQVFYPGNLLLWGANGNLNIYAICNHMLWWKSRHRLVATCLTRTA